MDPRTGNHFKKGDARDDGITFSEYSITYVSKKEMFYKKWKQSAANLKKD